MPQLTYQQIGLALLAFVFAFLAWKGSQYATDAADLAYGASNGQIVQAAVRFSQTQRTTIMNAINACGGCAVSYTAANMISAGALDPSYSGNTTTGGSYCLEFRIYNTSYLQGVLTVVGETSPLNQANAIIAANNVGLAQAGYVSNGSLVYPGGSVLLSNFTGASACNPANNAFGALITDNQSITTTNYLCRVTLPGNATCNEMTLLLNMDGNNVTNAGLVQATSFTANSNTPVSGDADANDFNAVNALNGATLNVTGAANAASAAITGALTANSATIGTSVTATDFFQTSDERLKRDWEPIAHPCETLDAVLSGRYTYTPTGTQDIGVGAQSLIAAGLPQLVRLNPATGYYQVNYNGLVPVVMSCLAQTRAQLAAAAPPSAAERAKPVNHIGAHSPTQWADPAAGAARP